ncbi:hypothetical protein PDR5_10820 [Pseudomonas sp. DR 5-09]|nr:hypothetical protein PDR5_10820 [Pseudomonas sp. DR 5-09]
MLRKGEGRRSGPAWTSEKTGSFGGVCDGFWLTHLVDTPRSAFSSLSLRERAGGEGSYFSHCSNFKSKVKSYPLIGTPPAQPSPPGRRGEREPIA